MTGFGSALESVDDMLEQAEVILVAGPGGVGKTTVTAALGLRAARRHDRRVVVVTVDPARRLADALGVSRLSEEPVLVPVGGGDGRLWVVMVDMARSWDRLVERHAPDDDTRQRLLANSLYRTLTRRFVQSHDYIALDHLCDLTDEDRYDLVIVDTPPSSHAIDLLDAPSRMIEFFRSRLLRWLTSGASLTAVPARPFLALAERLLGAGFLAEITVFFTLLAKLRPAFVDRARRVEERLSDSTTTLAVVTTSESGPMAETGQLLDALVQRRLTPGLLVVNRFEPTLDFADSSELRFRPKLGSADLAAAGSGGLAAGVWEMQRRAEQAGSGELPAATLPVGCPVVALPWRAGELGDLDGLTRLIEGVHGSGERANDELPSSRQEATER